MSIATKKHFYLNRPDPDKNEQLFSSTGFIDRTVRDFHCFIKLIFQPGKQAL
jgi:hypothetical protein